MESWSTCSNSKLSMMHAKITPSKIVTFETFQWLHVSYTQIRTLSLVDQGNSIMYSTGIHSEWQWAWLWIYWIHVYINPLAVYTEWMIQLWWNDVLIAEERFVFLFYLFKWLLECGVTLGSSWDQVLRKCSNQAQRIIHVCWLSTIGRWILFLFRGVCRINFWEVQTLKNWRWGGATPLKNSSLFILF